MPKLPTFALPILAGVALLGVIVLAALHVAVPDVLADALKVLAGGVAGASVPATARAPRRRGVRQVLPPLPPAGGE